MSGSIPFAFLKGAMAGNATVEPRTVMGIPYTVVTFMVQNKYKVSGYIDDKNMVYKVETWVDNTVLGDMLVEAIYTDYKDYTGAKVPTTIINKQAGRNTLLLVVDEVKPNAAVNIQAPQTAQAPAAPPAVTVQTQKIANGVYYLMGGSHHSVVVEFADHLAVIEAPQNEARSLAVIREIRKSIGRKPIRYIINTHHHFDHSGGLRTYVQEGATVVTHDINKALYEKVLSPTAPRTLEPGRPCAREEKGADPHDRTRGRQESPDGQDPNARAVPDQGQPAQRRHPDGVPAGREDSGGGGSLHTARGQCRAGHHGQPEHHEPGREHRAAQAGRRQDSCASRTRSRHQGGLVQGGRQAGSGQCGRKLAESALASLKARFD